jgi:protein-S-isoprenylcysteine O-methyltransferase Ste14
MGRSPPGRGDALRVETASEFVQAAAAAVVILCWLALTVVFTLKARGPRPRETRRERASIAGIVLQSLGFGLVWGLQRRTFSPMTPDHPALGSVFAGLEIVLAIGSIWLTIAAARVLGKEWSFQARLVEGHRLMTEGPYALVRHPIYTGMLGMLLATALAFAHWIALGPALILYGAGTVIRVRSEEKLLREAFGQTFEEYARRVPAVLPGWR